jgi:hypothetical protein
MRLTSVNTQLGVARIVADLPSAVPLDPAEAELIRGDALEAIGQIDRGEGEALARRWATQEGFLGTTARELLSGERPEKRTYFQALLGCSDCWF